MDYCVITFASTHGAIYAQKRLEGLFPFQVMPVLREISAGCGIALRLAPEHLEAARTALAASELKGDEYAFYAVTGAGRSLRAEALFLS